MGLLNLLKRLLGPSRETQESEEVVKDICEQTADLTELRKTLRREKTRIRKKTDEAVSGIMALNEEASQKMKAANQPLSRDEAEKKLESFGWKERK